MSVEKILIEGKWETDASAVGDFQARDPRTGSAHPERFPITGRASLERMLAAGTEAAQSLRTTDPERIAAFLELCAENLQARADALVAQAQAETGLPEAPRLRDVELPRTLHQLRLAARATRQRDFCEAVIDTQTDIRRMRGPLGGPVAVFGPNNFPFAFNAVMGGDFAAAIAAGNPVIAKGHPFHPKTTQLLAQAAVDALIQSRLPSATLQLAYALPNELGSALVSHPRVAASAFTGSRRAGLSLAAAAHAAGKPMYLELSAVNPVFVLPGALQTRSEDIARELAGSCRLGAGQFCTKPGLSVVAAGELGRRFATRVKQGLESERCGALFGPDSAGEVAENVGRLTAAGATLSCGGQPSEGPGFGFEPTLLEVEGAEFLRASDALQTEAFGPVHLMVHATAEQMEAIARSLQGSLTGCIYSDPGGTDDAVYARIERQLRFVVGRLLNDKMPTGVAVSAAMNHGGPYPSTSHPGFTSVGMPGAIQRFTALHCYDGVRHHRLPPELRDENPTGKMWRCIDGAYTQK